MSESAKSEDDPETVDATARQSVSNDPSTTESGVDSIGEGDPLAQLDAEAVEEQHLDERHATTGEFYTGGNDFDEVAPVTPDDDTR